MKYNLQSELFFEYKELKNILTNDKNIIELVSKRNKLNEKLRNLDVYTTEYANIKVEYDEVSHKLNDDENYNRFKVLERELNLFVMYCNKELSKLFDLDEKGCSK